MSAVYLYHSSLLLLPTPISTQVDVSTVGTRNIGGSRTTVTLGARPVVVAVRAGHDSWNCVDGNDMVDHHERLEGEWRCRSGWLGGTIGFGICKQGHD